MKRATDLALIVPGLLVSLPAAVVVSLLVRRQIGKPVIFRQTRAGRDGNPFVLYKFRTMREPVPGRDNSDEARLTPLGRRLRAWSLDEWPQVVNVLKGDMSLVGPRPLPLTYVDRYSSDQRRRLEVSPGITGLAQVSGRNALSWEQKLALDVEYVDRCSLRLDLWILWRTAAQVLTRRGVSAEGHATMPEFLGTSEAA